MKNQTSLLVSIWNSLTLSIQDSLDLTRVEVGHYLLPSPCSTQSLCSIISHLISVILVVKPRKVTKPSDSHFLHLEMGTIKYSRIKSEMGCVRERKITVQVKQEFYPLFHSLKLCTQATVWNLHWTHSCWLNPGKEWGNDFKGLLAFDKVAQ